jgi:molybdopterin converting factor small subunit
MHISVKCFATLAKHTPDGADRFEGADGSTVADVIATLGIPAEAVKIVFLDGVAAAPNAPLGDGCRLGIFPAVGGG